ncbi:TrmH family RNA methyltransferase [Corynebacterium pelargi]|uniref:23S rRNA methyltransferase n=1 Tax=Corynebacterium pelargi TaxID=1471400 RepID=A0A410WB44_9CORY|nr:TrmH family RNA methyltransferase [Corynebacterium pelargi]QAU53177.1 23S rRNA methyltransferase [Corynebacterium pelargi]GGG74308.1 23S rRNA methyltransferase [Corynebacterium pelargi]
MIESLLDAQAREISAVIDGEVPGRFIIDDEENIEQALLHGLTIHAVFGVGDRSPSETLGTLLEREQIALTGIAVHVAKKLFGSDKRPRLFALAETPPPSTLKQALEGQGDVVVLDGVRLPGNIGAIIRTAAGLGAAAVVLVDSGLDDALDRRLVRASRGLVFALPVVLSTREDTLAALEAQEIPLVSLAADASEALAQIAQLEGRIALVMGSERKGVSTQLHEHAKHRYAIAMREGVESLNVSVATGIALYTHGARDLA